MGIVKKENIVGIHTDREILCANCMEDSDWDSLKEENIITEEEATNGDDLYFCDGCKEQLPTSGKAKD